jgi:hypothetical protein
MKKLALPILLLLLAINSLLQAQDTLPNFSLKNVGNNRIIVGWTNNFQSIKQISIQRSFDSLKGYKTILTVPDPTTPQNGYADTKATNDHMFYRLYIMLDKGIYMFSDAKKPVKDTSKRIDPINIVTTTTMVNDTVILQNGDTLVTAKPFVVNLDKFPGTDSITAPNPGISKTKPNAFTPSLHVFTSRDGYVRINLPDEEKSKKYSIKFFKADDTFLFELKEIKEKNFKIDKTNFYAAGWFKFELYEDEKLIEKHKFYLERDF